MGRLTYDSTLDPIIVDDVTLAHMRIIVGTKLPRQESFVMSWTPGSDSRDGRLTAWIHPSNPLGLAFDSAEPIRVDAGRVAAMMNSLNAHGELPIEEM
ncbi:hypothetical protein [Microbacterium phyllosphaerae]|uniref:DUF7882 family protein n=1 Tax=Microbacterium phyllosphaerae TaxID=124798 RepID=UPI003D6485C1